MSQGSSSRRDDRIDFLRGVALLVIFIDHVPKNLFAYFTLHSFAFCDAAEVFFFLSGLVAALVYGRLLERKGFAAATKKVWRRAGVVYAAQMLLLAAILALVPLFIFATGDQTIQYIFRVQDIYQNPLAYVLPILTLHYQPGYLDILPAYVVLLAVFPLVLTGLRRHLWLVLAVSAAVWLSALLFGLTFWNTAGGHWFFNPFAWQFLFVAGAVFGHPASRGRFAALDNRWVFYAAVAISLPIAVIQMSDTLSQVVWWVHSWRPQTVLLDKTALGPLRLVSFFALAVIARHLLPASGFLTTHASTLPVVRCGRFSLQVFTAGALLASLTVPVWRIFGDNFLVQSLLVVVGVAAQLAYAAWKDRRREESAAVLAVSEPLPVRSKTPPPRR